MISCFLIKGSFFVPTKLYFLIFLIYITPFHSISIKQKGFLPFGENNISSDSMLMSSIKRFSIRGRILIIISLGTVNVSFSSYFCQGTVRIHLPQLLGNMRLCCSSQSKQETQPCLILCMLIDIHGILIWSRCEH